MTTIGYATLQLIPSLDGVSKSVEKQLGSLDGKKFGKAFGKDIASGVKASEADVKRAMDGYSKLYDKSADAAGKLRTELAKLDDAQKSGNQTRIIAQTERVEKARRDEARAVRDARDAYKDYETAAKQAATAGDNVGGGLLDKIKGLAGSAKSGGTDAASGFVEGFGGPIAALGTKAGPIGLALAAAAALGVGAGALIAKQVFAGMEQEQQQANVAAKLGLTPEQMKPIADASAAAYASNFGESVAANMDTARAAIQSGLLDPSATQADVQKMVEQLSTVSSVMGEEIPATARAAQQAIRTGLVGDATGAFDLFTKAQQSGLNVSEDFLDTINEYGTQFRKLGLDGPEAVGLISQAVKGGARDSDVAADAIKEFSIRAVDGSKTSADAFAALGLNAEEMTAKFAQGGPTAKAAFDQVVDSIRGLDDPVKQASVSVGLFGTQSEDLGGALNSLDLSTAVGQLGAVDGAAQRAADTMGNTTASSVESAKRSFETASDSMQQSLAAAFGPTLQQGANWIVEHQDDIAAAFKWVAGGATEFGGAVVGAVGGIVTGFGYLVSSTGDTVGFMLDGFEQITGAAATVAGAFGLDGLEGDLRGAQTQLGVWSDQFHGWGEGLIGLGTNISNAGIKLHDLDLNTQGAASSAGNASQQVSGLGTAMGALPFAKNIDIQVNTAEAQRRLDEFFNNNSNRSLPVGVNPNIPSTTPGRNPLDVISGPGRSAGGMIPGFSTTDDRLGLIGGRGLIGLAGGEGIVKASATRRLGGKQFIDMLNGFADGGVVPPDVAAATALAGTDYSQGARTDCSGMVARVIARTLGMPESGLMSTKTASEWLAERGFVPGVGGPGQISVGWYDHGPNPNDGHMAMTLSDGRNAEAGGSVGPFTVGGSAQGASSPQFDQRMYLPTVYGEGPAGSSSASSPFAGGSATAAVTGAAPTASGGGTSASSGGGGSISLPSSLSGFGAFAGEQLGDLGKLGSAAGSFIDGQVSSVLDVFGVPDSPGWLKAISTLVGGISIGGGDGAALPLAASPSGMGTAPPDDPGNMHGSRAGQQPGPVYNITARDTEDAFIKAQRKERERAAAKLDRF